MGKIWNGVKTVWKSLDYIPKCPVCKGTGEPTGCAWDETVAWKGQFHKVCYNCKGTGYV